MAHKQSPATPSEAFASDFYLPISETDLQYANGAGPSKPAEEVIDTAPSPQANNDEAGTPPVDLATLPKCFEVNPEASEDLSEKAKGKRSANPVRFKNKFNSAPDDNDADSGSDTASAHPSDAPTEAAIDVEGNAPEDKDDDWPRTLLNPLPKSKLMPAPMKRRELTNEEKKNLIIRWAENVLKINLDGTTEPAGYAVETEDEKKKSMRKREVALEDIKIISREQRYGTAEEQARGLEGMPTLDANAMTQEEYDQVKAHKEKEKARNAARNRLMGRGANKDRRAWDEAGRALHLRMQESGSFTEEEFNALNEEARRAPPPQQGRFGLRREE